MGQIIMKRKQLVTGGSHLQSGYSRGRDKENCGLKPIQSNSSWDPILKKPFTKKGAGRVVQGVGPKFKPQNHKKKKENKQ
jgi:hypothetical protein